MDMIGLDSEFKNAPSVLTCNLTKKVLKTGLNGSNQNLAPSLGTPDDVVHDKVYSVPFVLVLHVYSIVLSTTKCTSSTFQALNKEWAALCKLHGFGLSVHIAQKNTDFTHL